MNDPAAPLFLEHRNYRRRRLLDAVRLLPFVGAILFVAPALMPRAAQMDLSGRVVYFFVAWSFLIAAIALSTRVASGETGGETGGEIGREAGKGDRGNTESDTRRPSPAAPPGDPGPSRASPSSASGADPDSLSGPL